MQAPRLDAPESADPTPTASGPEVSVVVPVYRNRATLAELVERLDGALPDETREYVFVVDGSPDDSAAVLLELQARCPHVVVLELDQNYGQHAALCAGFEAARGRVVLILDADLQQSPEELPRFLEAWRAGHDFVSGTRRTRRDALWRRAGSRLLNRILGGMIGVRLADWGCPIAAVDAAILRRVPGCGEQRRFLKPLVARLSRNVVELEVDGEDRAHGTSAYSLLTLVGVSLDAAVSFSDRPFQKLAGLGFLSAAVGTVGGTVYVGLRAAGALDPSPPAVALAAIAILLGFQVLVLGALGEFTHRIYRLVQGRPFYAVRATHRADHRADDDGGPA